MWRALIATATLSILGCVQIPESPQEIADKKIEPVPGKAVVYVVQNPTGNYNYAAGLSFDDGTQITTWPGTFYRWVTTPGTHTIRSWEANLSAHISLQLEAGRVYFVQHYVTGVRGSTTDARLERLGDQSGRQLVAISRLCCAVR